MFWLFDYIRDHDVKIGSVNITDIRHGKREKIVQMMKALRAWEDKRRAIAQSVNEAR